MGSHANVAKTAVNGAENRIVGLDGLRGLMTLFVVASHYFGEVRHGVAAMEVGWLAVKMFFALSGFLVGRLILERMTCEIAPVAALVATAIIHILGHGTGAWVSSLGFFLVSIGCAAFVLAIARGTSEARHFQSPILCFFGNTSYS